MKYIVSIGSNDFQVCGEEAAWKVFFKGCEFAALVGDECHLIDAETGEILGGSDIPDDDDEPHDIDSDFGYDPYMGECTYDC